MKAAAVLSCYLFVAKHMIWQIKLQRDNKRNPRKYRKIPWIFENEVKPEKAAAKFGKDEVASSNLASSSKPSEIFGFQRVSFVIAENRKSKVQNRQFCVNS